jgi:hypothetical protein
VPQDDVPLSHQGKLDQHYASCAKAPAQYAHDSYAGAAASPRDTSTHDQKHGQEQQQQQQQASGLKKACRVAKAAVWQLVVGRAVGG